MGIVAWIVLGLIAGFISSKIVNKRGDGFFIDVFLGIVGAFVGGWACQFFGMTGVSGFNIYSILVATGGAITTLVLWHIVRRAL